MAESDVASVKSHIVQFMIQLPPNLQAQIGEAVSVIADSDFPERWTNLVPDLVSRLSDNISSNNGVLTVAHSIFTRWRPLFQSDALFSEIKLVLDQFCAPFLNLLLTTDKLIDQNVNNKEALIPLFQSMNLIINIYYDLNCQDIPEFFEDNLSTGFEIVHKYLIYTNPLLNSDDEDESGPLETLKASICELLQLYTQRYEDVFGPLLAKFVESTWTLLTSTGSEPKYDILISKALTFLTAVAKIPRHAEMFSSEEVLQQIIKSILLPNITLQTSDEEMFEDDPIEYTRRDLEGSDSDTRRRSCIDFLRELTDKNESKITQVVMVYVNEFLSNYNANKGDTWRQKDTAIYLFSSIAAKGNVTNAGVTSTNLLVDVVSFFAQNVAPDLVTDKVHPILEVDAIKYIHTFRNQLTKEQLVDAFPLLSTRLLSPEYVVYTYAAITIEKILSLRNQGGSTMMFEKTDIAPVAQSLLGNLFFLIMKGNTPEKIAENEFLMKCVMRILIVAQDSTSAYAEEILKQLLAIVGEISKNPSNPKFSHYTFEAIGAIIKYSVNTIGAQNLENGLFPPFMEILGADVSEFVPYVFQILAQVLAATPLSAGISQNYVQLIRPLMSPAVWELRGNIPALVALLQGIVTHGGKEIVETGNLVPLLGVFQKLIASKANDGYGLSLLDSILYSVPSAGMKEYLNQVAVLVMQRLQSSSTDKYVSRLSSTIYFLAAAEKEGLGPVYATDLFDATQNGVFGQIFSKFLLPATAKIQNLRDRKIATIGLTKLLTQNPKFMYGEYNSKWAESLDVLLELLGTDLAAPMADNAALELDLEEVSFGSSFSKLATTVVAPINPSPSVSDPKAFFISEIKRVNVEFNGQLGQLVKALPVAKQQVLASMGLEF